MTREILDDWQTASEILDAGHILHLAMIDKDGPYCIPLDYVRMDKRLYLHCGKSGKKLDVIARDKRVSFAVETNIEVKRADLACKWGHRFRSVVGFGTAHIVTNEQERLRGMNALIVKWAGKPQPMNEKIFLNKTVIVRIDIASATSRIRT